jgi:hypothetical protein
VWKLILLLLILICSACNLSAAPPTPLPTETQPPTFLVTATPDGVQPTPDINRPTRLPLPGLPDTGVPVTSAPLLNTTCQVYTTYSGARADNTLSLRSDPSTEAPQVFRVPNRIEVLRVPGSQEVEADGYHWLNVIYEESAQMRYIGWIARDSFEVNGVRDTSVATLRRTATHAPC